MSFKSKSNIKYLGVDTGGTFTDFVYVDGDNIRIHKVLSTPDAPERAILQGIEELDVNCHELRIVHGSTVATNAVLEAKGAKTVYVANRGLKDVLTIGRQARQELYNLQPRKIKPPVPEQYCLEINTRLAADGTILEPLTDDDIAEVVDQIRHIKPDAVAINLLFSFIDGRFEEQIANALPEDLFVSCSHEVLPEYREYERGITTWLNAYVGPLLQGYLQRLELAVEPASVSVMRSSGQTCRANQAAKQAVHLLLSGPAGGLNAAEFISDLTDEKKLLTFDMGGTSTDVAMFDGQLALSNQGRLARFPVAVPMVDMHTIGAGGGSLAWLDQGGALQVGPESSGANPGPASYGQGGTQATVTDANLILGRLPRSTKLGGTMQLDYPSAEKAMKILMQESGLPSIEETALGIVRIANENMAQALRVISVERGIDPREFVLLAFGGAGGLHICALAEALQMTKAIVPVHAGVLSAFGMLVARPGRELSHTLGKLLLDCRVDEIENALDELLNKGKQELIAEGIDPTSLSASPSLDLCYQGQSSSLNISWTTMDDVAEKFQSAHLQRYGHTLDNPLELVNVHMSVNAPKSVFQLPAYQATSRESQEVSQVYGHAKPVQVLLRSSIQTGQPIEGPVIVIDENSTVCIAENWQVHMDRYGNLLLAQKI